VVRDFHARLPEAEIYVYDNNSTDGSMEEARRGWEGVKIRREYRQGKGNVIRTMFRDVFADCYLMVDGDDTYPAEAAGEMTRMVLEEGADMVIGDRLSSTYYTENKRPLHNTGNKLVCALVNMFFGGKTGDIMTGYRAMSPGFVKTFPVLSRNFEIETEMTIHALDKNMLMRSVPVRYRDRPEGSTSKLNTYSDGARVLMTIFNLFRNYRPLSFFGSLAIALFTLGALFFIPVCIAYAKTGLLPRFPTFIASCIFFVMALQSFICGLILDSVVKRDRHHFEYQSYLVEFLRKGGG
jgi:glycosyltransferase involved in cell wall biosynthesis